MTLETNKVSGHSVSGLLFNRYMSKECEGQKEFEKLCFLTQPARIL
jgi:hypothetical protein